MSMRVKLLAFVSKFGCAVRTLGGSRETNNQFSLTRAASSTSGRVRNPISISNRSVVVSGLGLLTSVIIWFGLVWQPDLAQASCVPPPSGLVAWWPGEGNANDIISGDNGTLTDGAAFAAGEVGQGFSFGTDHAGILLGNPTNLQLQEFTIEAWIRRGSTNVVTTDPTAYVVPYVGAVGFIFGYGHHGYALELMDTAWGALLTFEIVDDVMESTGPYISDTNFHHVALTMTNGSTVYYVDGVGTAGFGGSSPSFEFTTQAAIGVRSDHLNGPDNRSFCGTIDELSVYNRALSADDIATIYAAGRAGKCRAGASASMVIDRNGGISVVGTVGATYCVQCVPDLNDTNWTTFTNFVLPQSPYRILDPDAPQWSSRFYRVQSGGEPPSIGPQP